jgi:hypothetical protein
MLQTKSEEFDAFDALLEDIKICDAIENIHTHTKALSKQKKHARSEFKTETIVNFIQKTVDHCKGIRKRNCREEEEYVSDERLSKLARFTDKMALKPFELFLQYVPRLVNVVTVYLSHGLSLPTVSLSLSPSLTVSHRLTPSHTVLLFLLLLFHWLQLAEAFPVPGSGMKLPLDLALIASRCSGAYFAPKRFSAVQLAYTNPKARVLIFRTCPCKTVTNLPSTSV